MGFGFLNSHPCACATGLYQLSHPPSTRLGFEVSEPISLSAQLDPGSVSLEYHRVLKMGGFKTLFLTPLCLSSKYTSPGLCKLHDRVHEWKVELNDLAPLVSDL